MKLAHIVFPALLASTAYSTGDDTIQVRSSLDSQESYRLYEFLSVPEVAEDGGRVLVKRTETVVCKRFGSYPGDREYECTIVTPIRRNGAVDVKDM